MSDALWIACITALGQVVTAIFALQAKRQSARNNVSLTAMKKQVTGVAASQALTEGRRNPSPQVLIIDDDIIDIELAERELKKFGCEVFRARGGNDAGVLLMSRIAPDRGFPFDFVIMDLRIPGEDVRGIFEMFERLAPRVPIVIVTGQISSPHLAEVCQSAPRFVLTKPLTSDSVRSILGQLGIPYYKGTTEI